MQELFSLFANYFYLAIFIPMKHLKLLILFLLPMWAFAQTDPAPSGAVVKPVTAYQLGDTTYIYQNGKWFSVVNRAYGDANYLTTSSNGITKSGLNFKLGGALTDPVTLITGPTNTLIFNTKAVGMVYGSLAGDFSTIGTDNNATSMFTIRSGKATGINMQQSDAKLYILDSINRIGATYGGKYNFTLPRQIVDKGYVDSVATGAVSSLDTTGLARKSGNSPITNKSYTALGTAGNGFFRVVSQSISPAKNASYLQVYRDSVNRFSYLNGIYRRTFAVPRSVDRTITYPYNNINPILADSSETATALGAKLNISDTAAMAYVHKAKVETITGTKTFSATNTSFANVIPTADATSNLGGASNRWSSAYILTTFTNNVRGLSGDISFIGTGGTTWGKIFNTTGDHTIQGGGTFTDNGYGLDVQKVGTAGVLNLAIGKIGITEGTNGRVGQTTLVSGAKSITISGVTTSSRAFITLVSIGGTVTTTWQYAAVCTANTLTITALTNAGTTNTSDTSVLNYEIIN